MQQQQYQGSNRSQVFGLDDDANVDDFMHRFSDPGTYVAPEEANQQFDRYLQSGHPELHEAAGSFMSQMDPSQFAQAAQNLQPEQRSGFAQRLLGALSSHTGMDLGGLARSIGLSSTDPNQMQPDDIGRLAGYAQRHQPGALQETAREQPFIFKALGNPLVQGALAVMAARFLASKRK